VQHIILAWSFIYLPVYVRYGSQSPCKKKTDSVDRTFSLETLTLTMADPLQYLQIVLWLRGYCRLPII